MFLQACVKNFVHPQDRQPQADNPPPHTHTGRQPSGQTPFPRDSHCSGLYTSYWNAFLWPPANEVWGKVICLQVCVCPQEGYLVQGGGGAWSQRGAWSRGCLVETPPPDGYCCGRYASYWNEFLLVYKYSLSLPSSKVQFAQIEAYFFSIVALDWHVKHCILKCLQGSRDNDKRCVSKYKFVIEIFQATKEWEWKSMSSIWKLLVAFVASSPGIRLLCIWWTLQCANYLDLI